MRTPFQENQLREIPMPQDQKLLEGAEIKELLKKGAAKDVTSAKGQFVSTIFLRPMKEKTFRPNLKNLNQVLPYQEFKT